MCSLGVAGTVACRVSFLGAASNRPAPVLCGLTIRSQLGAGSGQRCAFGWNVFGVPAGMSKEPANRSVSLSMMAKARFWAPNQPRQRARRCPSDRADCDAAAATLPDRRRSMNARTACELSSTRSMPRRRSSHSIGRAPSDWDASRPLPSPPDRDSGWSCGSSVAALPAPSVMPSMAVKRRPFAQYVRRYVPPGPV